MRVTRWGQRWGEGGACLEALQENTGWPHIYAMCYMYIYTACHGHCHLLTNVHTTPAHAHTAPSLPLHLCSHPLSLPRPTIITKHSLVPPPRCWPALSLPRLLSCDLASQRLSALSALLSQLGCALGMVGRQEGGGGVGVAQGLGLGGRPGGGVGRDQGPLRAMLEAKVRVR